MRPIIVLFCLDILRSVSPSQSAGIEKPQASSDSLAHAKMVKDSLRTEKLLSVAQYPLIKGGRRTAVIPVADPAEVPDPKSEYKLLFEVTTKNPDSLSAEFNQSLDEVARVLNMHIASGIPLKNISPVLVVHGSGIEVLLNNEFYRKKHAVDNPNVKMIQDLQKAGTRIIVCGQAMAWRDVTKDQLLPDVKITLSAQTVLSSYQSQGFILYSIKPDH